MGRHFTRVAIYSRISKDPPRHQAGGVRRHLPEGRRKQAGLLLGDTDFSNADDMLTLRIKGAVAMN
jgi:hypothetical protein